jgi:hypothetical protein
MLNINCMHVILDRNQGPAALWVFAVLKLLVQNLSIS